MNRLQFISVALVLILLSSAGCAPQPAAPAATDAPAAATSRPVAPDRSLTVFAAASLTEPFNELGRLFEAQNPGVKVAFSFAGSQQLAQQIDQGAPADVFASANKKYMDAMVETGRVSQAAPLTFAQNRLVVIYPQDNPGGVQQLADLAKPGLKLDFAAKEVPVGQYSLDFLDKATQDASFGAGFKDAVLRNVVSYEENVKAVLVKVSLGEADAGIVYLSDVSGESAGDVGILDIPDALNVIATYPIAVIHDSPQPELAQAFVTLVLSPEGQQVLEKFNFVPAAGK